jgi:hypothetical protein
MDIQKSVYLDLPHSRRNYYCGGDGCIKRTTQVL